MKATGPALCQAITIMADHFTIRRVTSPEDWELARCLDRRIFTEDAPVEIDGQEVFLAFDVDHLPVAFATMDHAAWASGRHAFLSRCGVVHAARGHGLQRRLIRARVQRARAMGCIRCYTYTVLDNVSSANNLIACGFQLYNSPSQYAGKSLYFQKFLESK